MNAHLPAIHDKEAIYAALLAKVAPAENDRMRAANGLRTAALDGTMAAARSQVRAGMDKGLCARQIADETGLSANAVAQHMRAIGQRARPEYATGAETVARIARAIRNAGRGLTYEEIISATGLGEKTVRMACTSAARSGDLIRTQRGSAFRRTLAIWSLSDVSAIPDGWGSMARDSVMGALSSRPGEWLSYDQISEISGRPRYTVVSTMRWLKSHGFVEVASGARPQRGGSSQSIWRAVQK